MKRHNCQARQYGDQMICAPCGLNWDTNDPEPPECRKKPRTPKIEVEAPKVSGLPVELPVDVAAEMVRTYQANRGGLPGMRAAYRLFLDRVEP